MGGSAIGNGNGTGTGYDLGSIYGKFGQSNHSIPGPFSFDPNQVAGDTSAIAGLGATQFGQTNALAQQQYNQLLQQAPTDVANTIQQENPGIEEDLNATGQLNSSAYPTELAREQTALTQNLLLPATQQLFQGQRSALGLSQSAGESALGRQFSLEDFINQANVAKTIGAQMAPQPASGKSSFGTAAAGLGALGQGIGAIK